MQGGRGGDPADRDVPARDGEEGRGQQGYVPPPGQAPRQPEERDHGERAGEGRDRAHGPARDAPHPQAHGKHLQAEAGQAHHLRHVGRTVCRVLDHPKGHEPIAGLVAPEAVGQFADVCEPHGERDEGHERHSDPEARRGQDAGARLRRLTVPAQACEQPCDRSGEQEHRRPEAATLNVEDGERTERERPCPRFAAEKCPFGGGFADERASLRCQEQGQGDECERDDGRRERPCQTEGVAPGKCRKDETGGTDDHGARAIGPARRGKSSRAACRQDRDQGERPGPQGDGGGRCREPTTRPTHGLQGEPGHSHSQVASIGATPIGGRAKRQLDRLHAGRPTRDPQSNAVLTPVGADREGSGVHVDEASIVHGNEGDQLRTPGRTPCDLQGEDGISWADAVKDDDRFGPAPEAHPLLLGEGRPEGPEGVTRSSVAGLHSEHLRARQRKGQHRSGSGDGGKRQS